MIVRVLPAIVATALWILAGSVANAAGTVVLQKLGGSPQTFSGAQLLLQSPKLVVSLPDKRKLVFEQSSCSNSEEIMECQPIGVSVRTKAGTSDLNVTDGIGYFNLTKVPQPIDSKPPQKLPRHGIFITLHTDDGAKITIRGTLDAGASILTGN